MRQEKKQKLSEPAENPVLQVTLLPLSCYLSIRPQVRLAEVQMNKGAIPTRETLQERYGEGYFHGVQSGYPPEGYRAAHPDWAAWLGLLQKLRPGGRLIDVGCAYGYLTGEARQRGFKSFGADISRFALTQEPDLRPWLVQADVTRLPFQGRAADIITLFDVLEHLDDPESCLEESRRILKPDGFLLGATPDPIFFDRTEPTHVSERPPSYWLAVLDRLGFAVRFRFSGTTYNFQFLATPLAGSSSALLSLFGHDYFEPREEILATEEPLQSSLRAGWGSPQPDGRQLAASPASIYLLNPGPFPLEVDIRIELSHTPDFSTLRLRVDSAAVAEVTLDSERTERTVTASGVLMAAGGHHLFFDLFPGGPQVTVRSVSFSARPTTRTALTEATPFDLFQRYRFCAEVVSLLQPDRVLDIGGYLGDENGHLAVSHDFLQDEESALPPVRVTDFRQCDHPDCLRAPAWEQPFPDRSFDLVMSIDVLEHLSGDQRSDYLEELDRVARRWILLGAPFASAEVEAAETRLAGLMSARRFLQEHRELGLPEAQAVESFFRSRGYTLLAFPNGYLPRWEYWQIITQHYFALGDYQVARTLNFLYNQACYSSDNRAPAYRTIYLVCKEPARSLEQKLKSWLDTAPDAPADCVNEIAHQPQFAELHSRIALLLEQRQKALTDAHFLANARQEYIRMLSQELEESRKPLWSRAVKRWYRWRQGR
jgi:SAM-dependent methyltransferase